VWNNHDTLLVVKLVVAILVIVVLVARYRFHPFIALTIAALGMGLVAPEPPADLIDWFKGGAGDVLGNVGIILALGTMLGALLANSGGAQQIAHTIIARSGGGSRLPWAMALIAMIVGILLFFEIGVVLLIPIIFTVARELAAEGRRVSGSTYLLVGIPALAGLSVPHGLVPWRSRPPRASWPRSWPTTRASTRRCSCSPSAAARSSCRTSTTPASGSSTSTSG
jgi:gluconate:H+ symporter, GntP family